MSNYYRCCGFECSSSSRWLSCFWFRCQESAGKREARHARNDFLSLTAEDSGERVRLAAERIAERPRVQDLEEALKLLGHAFVLQETHHDACTSLVNALGLRLLAPFEGLSRNGRFGAQEEKDAKILVKASSKAIREGAPLPIAPAVERTLVRGPADIGRRAALFAMLIELRIKHPENEELIRLYAKLLEVPGIVIAVRNLIQNLTEGLSPRDQVDTELMALDKWNGGLTLRQLNEMEEGCPATFEAYIKLLESKNVRILPDDHIEWIFTWQERYPNLDFSQIWAGAAGAFHAWHAIKKDTSFIRMALTHIKDAHRIDPDVSKRILDACDLLEGDGVELEGVDYDAIRARALKSAFNSHWIEYRRDPESMFEWIAEHPQFDEVVAKHCKLSDLCRYIRRQLPLARPYSSYSSSSSSSDSTPHPLVRLLRHFTEQQWNQVDSKELRRFYKAVDGIADDASNSDHEELKRVSEEEICERIEEGRGLDQLKMPLIKQFIDNGRVGEISGDAFVGLCRLGINEIEEFLEESECDIFATPQLSKYLNGLRQSLKGSEDKGTVRKVIRFIVGKLERSGIDYSSGYSSSNSDDTTIQRNIAALVRLIVQCYRASCWEERRDQLLERIEAVVPLNATLLLRVAKPLKSHRTRAILVERISELPLSHANYLQFLKQFGDKRVDLLVLKVLFRHPSRFIYLAHKQHSRTLLRLAARCEFDPWGADSSEATMSESDDPFVAGCRRAMEENPDLLMQARIESQWRVVEAFCDGLADEPDRELLNRGDGKLYDGWKHLATVALSEGKPEVLNAIVSYPFWSADDLLRLTGFGTLESKEAYRALNAFAEQYPDQVEALKNQYEIDPAHYHLEVHEELDLDSPPDVDLNDLLSLTAEYLPDHVGTIEAYLSKIRMRVNNVAIPSNEREKTEWYLHLEAKLKYLIDSMNKLPEGEDSDDLKRLMLTWQVEGQNACGERWQFEAIHAITTMRKLFGAGSPSSSSSSESMSYLDQKLVEGAYNLRMHLFFLLIGNNTNVHRYNKYLIALKEHGFHLEATHKDAVSSTHGNERIVQEFTELYNIEALVRMATEVFEELLASQEGELEVESAFLDHLRGVLKGEEGNTDFMQYLSEELESVSPNQSLLRNLWSREDTPSFEELDELLTLVRTQGTDHTFCNLLPRADLRAYFKHKCSTERRIEILKKALPKIAKKSDIDGLEERLAEIDKTHHLLDETELRAFLGDSVASWAGPVLSQAVSDEVHMDFVRRNSKHLIEKHSELLFDRLKSRLFDALAQPYLNSWFFHWDEGQKSVSVAGVHWALCRARILKPLGLPGSSSSSSSQDYSGYSYSSGYDYDYGSGSASTSS